MATDEMMEEAGLEGETNVIIEDLSAIEGDLTLDDLRQIPGTEDLSDADLQKMWDEANKGTQASPTGTGETTPASVPARSWKYLGVDGKEVSDIDNLTVKQFLSGKISYNAMNKLQQESVDELIRVAQLGHLNGEKLNTALAERNAAHTKATETAKQLDSFQTYTKMVGYALEKYVAGDPKPLQQLIDKFAEYKNNPPAATQPASTSAAEAERQLEGQRVYYETIVPAARELAQRYGIQDANQVAQEILKAIDEEPAEFFNGNKLQQILQYDMPQRLERYGFKTNGAAPTSTATPTPTADNKALLDRIAALEAQVTNTTTARVRARSGRTPPGSAAPGSTGASGKESVIPESALKNANAFKDFLKS